MIDTKIHAGRAIELAGNVPKLPLPQCDRGSKHGKSHLRRVEQSSIQITTCTVKIRRLNEMVEQGFDFGKATAARPLHHMPNLARWCRSNFKWTGIRKPSIWFGFQFVFSTTCWKQSYLGTRGLLRRTPFSQMPPLIRRRHT